MKIGFRFSSFGCLIALVGGCGDTSACYSLQCAEPFAVSLRGSALEQPTTVTVEADGENATFECPAPPEPTVLGRCVPDELVGEQFIMRVEHSSDDGVTMDVYVRQNGGEIGPTNSRVTVANEAGDVLFDETFEAEYGSGEELNGPGCGRCYEPVEFERSL